jgi:hypothetical protein
VARGRDAIRESWGRLFAESPALSCTVLHRDVRGAWVADEELVTGLRGGPAVRAWAIYEVDGGLLRRAWLLSGDPAAGR